MTLGVNAEDEMGCMLKLTLLRMQACTLRPRKLKAEFVSGLKGVSVRYSEIPTVIDFHQSPMIHIPLFTQKEFEWSVVMQRCMIACKWTDLTAVMRCWGTSNHFSSVTGNILLFSVTRNKIIECWMCINEFLLQCKIITPSPTCRLINDCFSLEGTS